MPAKKAPATTSAPAPAPAKSGGVDAKKDKPALPKPQGNAKAQGQVTGPAQGKGQQPAPQPKKPFSSDPAEAAIERKMFEIDTKISALNSELDKIRSSLDAEDKIREGHRAEQTPLIQQMQGGSTQNKQYSDEKKDLFDQIKEVKRLRGLKFEERKTLRAKLTGNTMNLETVDGQAKYLLDLDNSIRALEKELASSSVPLAVEKKKLEEISNIQRSKKLFKDFMALIERIDADTKQIKTLKDELDKSKVTQDEFIVNRKSIGDKLDEIKVQIKASDDRRTLSKERMVAVKNEIAELRGDNQKEWEKLKEVRNKKSAEIAEKRRVEKEAYLAKKKEYLEKKQEREAEREKQSELQIPYADEMEDCETLISYLQKQLPQKTKEESTPDTKAVTAGSADYTVLNQDEDKTDTKVKPKGKKQKMKVAQGLKHDVTTFQLFEKVSLVPPSKVADIEASIAELQDKKKHFSKLSEDKIAAKKQEAAAKAAAKEAAAKEEEAAKEASKENATEVASEESSSNNTQE